MFRDAHTDEHDKNSMPLATLCFKWTDISAYEVTATKEVVPRLFDKDEPIA